MCFLPLRKGVVFKSALSFENMLTLKVDVSTNYEELLTSSRSIYARDAAQVYLEFMQHSKGFGQTRAILARVPPEKGSLGREAPNKYIYPCCSLIIIILLS